MLDEEEFEMFDTFFKECMKALNFIANRLVEIERLLKEDKE